MSSDDVRKDKRTPVIIKFRFRSATIDEFIEQYSRDISRGGIFVKHKEPLPVRTLVKFEFKLKTDQAVIRGVGRVVWTRDMAHAPATVRRAWASSSSSSTTRAVS